MQLHLDETACHVTAGVHAALLLDQAGRHIANLLEVPANLTLVPLPPGSPELNPTENMWQGHAPELAVELATSAATTLPQIALDARLVSPDRDEALNPLLW